MSPATQIVSVGRKLFIKQTGSSISKIIVIWWANNFKLTVAEFVSTLLQHFIGCMSFVPIDGLAMNPPMYSAIGFGLAILFNISSFGHISGAHMNPSVTLCAIIWGNMSVPLGIAYVVAQCGGAIVGYGLLVIVSPKDLVAGSVCATVPHPNLSSYQVVIIEIILTMALGFTNCSVWDPVNKEKQGAASLKFGFTVAALSLAGGYLTGASTSPASTLGPAFWTGNWNTHWAYWVGPLLGGAIAPIMYKLMWLECGVNKK